MELSVREAAVVLGVSPRAVRARLARGELTGTKQGKSWRIRRESLPLNEDQRRALRRRADDVREAIDEALPSRAAARHGDRRRSVEDIECFRRGRDVLAAMRTRSGSTSAAPAAPAAAERALVAGLLAVCEGIHAYDPERKAEALRRARRSMSRCIGLLLLESTNPEGEPLDWAARLESEVLPAVGGLIRWSEKLGRGRR